MKKIFIGIVVMVCIAIAAAAVVGYIAMRGIMHYPRLTLEKVYGDAEQRAIYGIGNARTPKDYGFEFQELAYHSSGGIKLSGWYVAPKNTASDKCYVLVHGRSSNRLKSLKYLELISALGLQREYAVFLPDLRNSGNSDEAPTAMGYYFAEDIFHTLQHLNETKGRKQFVLHGFSMGAMGISCLVMRQNLMNPLKARGIRIEHIILDSPVANVRRNLFTDITENKKLPSVLAHLGLFAFNLKIGGELDKMALGKIYAHTEMHVLVLAAKDDIKTPLSILEDELKMVEQSRVKYVIFEKGNHARLFNEMPKQYIRAVGEFLK